MIVRTVTSTGPSALLGCESPLARIAGGPSFHAPQPSREHPGNAGQDKTERYPSEDCEECGESGHSGGQRQSEVAAPLIGHRIANTIERARPVLLALGSGSHAPHALFAA